jgi:hypothetical protein
MPKASYLVRTVVVILGLILLSPWTAAVLAADCNPTCDPGDECDPYGDGCGLLDFECYYREATKTICHLNCEAENFEREICQLTEQVAEIEEIATEFVNRLVDTPLTSLGVDVDAVVRLEAALDFVHDRSDDLLTEFEAFAADPQCASDPCAGFRSRLAGLLIESSELANVANDALAQQLQVDGHEPLAALPFINTERLASFVANAPPALLFPLYYALTVAAEEQSATPLPYYPECTESYCGLFVPLETLMADLQLLVIDYSASQAEAAGWMAAPASLSDDYLCTQLFADPEAPDLVASIASNVATVSKVLSAVAGFFAEPTVSIVDSDDEWGFAFGGEAALAVSRRPGQVFGVGLRMATDPLRLLGESLNVRVTDCRQRLEQYLTICALANGVNKNDSFDDCKDRVLDRNGRFGF